MSVDRLRREQAQRVMPLIGPLLDAWDALTRDERDEVPNLAAYIRKIRAAMLD